MHTMQIIKNILWYGSWVLIGITLGLLISPATSHAATLYDSITNPISSYTTTYGDSFYINDTGYFECNAIYLDTDSTIDSFTFSVAPSDADWANDGVYMILYNITATSSGDATTGYFSENAVTLGASNTAFATSTWTFNDVYIEASDLWCFSFYNPNIDGLSSDGVRIRIGSSRVLTGLYPSWTGQTEYYRDYNDYKTFSTEATSNRFLTTVTGTAGTVVPPTAATTSGYITGVYPVDGTYDVATTTYVNMSVTIPSDVYAQADWKAKISCAEVTEQTYFESLTDWGFSYTVDLTDGDCGSGVECTPHGVSYPEDGEIESDSVYNCTASLYKVKWYWFDTLVESQKFRFYTFSATSSADFAELIALADQLAGSVNVTGTSTNPVFGDCSILTGQISDCVIEPIKYLLIPSQTNKDDIKDLIDTTVFDKFPFSYIGLFNEEMASTTFYATTSAEFPDFAFEIQNMNGATTTITIFDGSEFVSAWSTVEEFDTLRTAIQYALVIMFTTILYFRVRRLIPSGDNVKGV